MTNKEFYFNLKGEIMIVDENGAHQLTQSDREFISELIKQMEVAWPKALEKASIEYEKSIHNTSLFEFKIVRRFLKCNLSKYDSVINISQIENIHLEEINCPLRGECSCEGIICKSKLNNSEVDKSLHKKAKEEKSLLNHHTTEYPRAPY